MSHRLPKHRAQALPEPLTSLPVRVYASRLVGALRRLSPLPSAPSRPAQPGPFLGQPGPHFAASPESTLGPPLDIRQTARLIGLSPWTIRHTLIPQGLPHFRSGASGKLIFYRDQVVAWICAQQQGGNQ